MKQGFVPLIKRQVISCLPLATQGLHPFTDMSEYCRVMRRTDNHNLVVHYWKKDRGTLTSLFREVAALNPHKTALVSAEKSLTYCQLDLLSDSLAAGLIASGVRQRGIVAILLDKSIDYIVSALAILKAQAAYLPLELAYPKRFLQYVFTEASPDLVITRKEYVGQIPENSVQSLLLDEIQWENNRLPDDYQDSIHSQDLAILGYSSGTTGRPKGILVSHRATLYAYAKFWEEILRIPEVSRFAYTAFVAWDALNPLLAGATGYIVPDAYSYDPMRLTDYFAHHRINHTFFTPSLLNSVLNRVPAEELKRKLTHLNLIWLGGEVTTPGLVDRAGQALPHVTLVNNYGPAECFVIAQGELHRHETASPRCSPVGKVLPEMSIRIQNEQGECVPQGEVGELLATGPCLGDGYLANPTLTAEKFVDIDGVIYYKTGDDAYLLPDERLVIIGRRDSTVKIRGYNVNLAAIEVVLKNEADVADCVVLAIGGEENDKYLAAYVVASQRATWQVDSLSATCPAITRTVAAHLPHYMIPTLFFQLNTIPIDPISQKADKKTLAQQAIQRRTQYRQVDTIKGTATHLPAKKQQELLISVVEQLLALPENSISCHDNLFENGLHSLLAVKLALKIEELFEYRIFIEDIYNLNNITAIIARIHGHILKKSKNIIADADFSWSGTIAGGALKTLSEANHILLTGSTGFIGIHMLNALLQTSQARITCLVRAGDSAPEERIRRQLERYRLSADSHTNRVQVVVGDLGRGLFGLEEALYRDLSENVDMVFHCAAAVNMLLAYRQLKNTNVEGTKHLARFCLSGKLKALHYLSTTGVYPESPIDENGRIKDFSEEIKPEELIQDLYTGYSISKCVAEKVIQNASALGLAVNVYRPGNVGAARDTDIANPQDTLLLVLDACRKVRAAPVDRDWFFEVMPVDFIVTAMTAIAKRDKHLGHSFNISSIPLAANEVFNLMYDRKEIDRLVSFEQWLDMLQQCGKERHDPMLQIISDTILTEEKFFLKDLGLSTSQFEHQMRLLNLSMPEITPEYCAAFRNSPSY